MSQYTDKVFIFNNFPSGQDVLNAIKDHSLEGWSCRGVQEIRNEATNLAPLSPYRYELRFRRFE